MNRKRTVIIVTTVFLVAFLHGCAKMMQEEPSAAAFTPGESVREVLNMDFGWKFSLGHAADIDKDFDYWGGDPSGDAKTGETAGPPHPGFDDSTWEIVDLPHDWALGVGYDEEAEALHAYMKIGRKYPENCIGWYSKSFEIPEEDLGKRITLEFDGIFRDSKVWLNGHLMWEHESGYTSFGFDITDYVNHGGKNRLVIRADATGYELWSYEGAGIYRHVRLVKTASLHVEQWGTYVSSEVKQEGDNASAVLSIETTLENQQDENVRCDVISTVVDPQGIRIAEVSTQVRYGVWGWSKRTVQQKVQVKDAQLWSLETPNLYKMFTTIKQNGEVVDTYETTFGIRTIQFDPDKGFFLNGKHVKIKGVCLHQDHGGLGIAVPDAVQKYRVKRVKEMGSNAIRTAHNWVTPEALDACDEQGCLVMDETRMSGSTRDLLEQLGTMIRRDRNHPSIIIWCLGNEEIAIQDNVTGQRIMRSMRRLVRKLDSTRPVSLAVHGGDGGPVNESLDILGCNYLNLGDLDALHAKQRKPIYVSEASCTSTVRGIYERDEMHRSTGYDDGAYSPGWGRPAEQSWKYVAEREFLLGTFVWTGFDYGGEPDSNRWPCVHTDWGVMDRACFPKDNYYYYQSWWGDKTVLHVLPHWNWAGKEGEKIWIWCHSNCDEVELIVNGESKGRKEMPRNSHLEWYAKYEPGYIEVKGYNDGELVATTIRETTGKAAAMRLKPDRLKIKADNHDVSLVTVEVVDEQGRVVPIANNEIKFSIEGDGKIIGICNGDPACHVLENETTYPTFNGLLMVFVQSGFEPGPITLKAKSQGLESTSVIIEAQACDVKPYVIPVLDEKYDAIIKPPGGTFSNFDNVIVTLTAPSKHVNLRYTLDGKDPDHTSRLYTGPFKLRCPAIVKTRAFFYRKGVGPIVTAEFKESE